MTSQALLNDGNECARRHECAVDVGLRDVGLLAEDCAKKMYVNSLINFYMVAGLETWFG